MSSDDFLSGVSASVRGMKLSFGGFEPAELSDRISMQMGERNKLFYQKRASLATDFVAAKVQGLTDNFYTWTSTDIRLSDTSLSNQTALDGKRSDDFKEVLIPDIEASYFPVGAKIQTMGSTWICFNPKNLSDVSCGGLVARCNAVYHTYDAYGNVVSEPLCLTKYFMFGNRNESPENLVLQNGYFTLLCQKNSITAHLSENKRLLLGQKAFSITGFSDFFLEFSDTEKNAHLLTYTVRVEEPTENDDLERGIADGKSFSFAVQTPLPSKVSLGKSAALTSLFVASGKRQTASDAFPLTFEYASSDEEVLTVSNGSLLAIGEGTAVISTTLKENPSLLSSSIVEVVPAISDTISFDGYVPSVLKQYSTAHLRVTLNGDTSAFVSWEVSGAGDCVTYTIAEDGLSLDIFCQSPSDVPLLVTASALSSGEGTDSVSAFIRLEGY